MFCYGTGEECGDPVDDSKGSHAYPYVHRVWAYHALDLLAVKYGDLQPWEVRPYALWTLTEMDLSGSTTVSGAAYDPVGGRVYIAERYGKRPAVYIYRITVAPSLPRDNAVYLPVIIG